MRIITERLSLDELVLNHAPFMFYLMNSPNWIAFIGDRNIRSIEDAESYIQKIVNTQNTDYWVIVRKNNEVPIGIVTLVKRDYLDHFDIGFALLPKFYGNEYALEATAAILSTFKRDKSHEKILATTLPSNKNSVRLLRKLGFTFREEIQPDQEVLHLYSVSCADQSEII